MPECPTRRSSISRRLLLAMSLSMPVLLGLTGLAIDRAYHSSLIKAEENRLKTQFFSLLGAIEWSGDRFDTSDRLKEPRFWQFRSGLYADIQGLDGALYWQSLSADTLQLPGIPSTEKGQRFGQDLFGEFIIDQRAFLYYRYYALWETDNGRDIPIRFSIYASKQGMLNELRQFRRQLALWLSMVALLSLALVTGLQFWGLKPLRKLARELRHLEKGDTHQLSDDYPEELSGITQNLNQLLEKERRQRERYRNTLGDLAHSLKTPLAVLQNNQLDDESRREQLSRMDDIIRHQLRRAVSGSAGKLGPQTPLLPALERLRNTLMKVYHSKNLEIHLHIDGNPSVAVDEDDLLELLGNLLDNACKACQERVTLSTSSAPGTEALQLCIDDDGAGLQPSEVEALLDRGRRGDQYGQGQGLGLAIVRDIADSCDIGLELVSREQAPGGRVRLTFPRR